LSDITSFGDKNIFFMRSFVAISVLDSNHDLGECINRLLKSTVQKDIYVYDLTMTGLDSELKRFIKSYNNYRVFLVRVKRASSCKNRNERLNLGMLTSLMAFNRYDKYSSYIHITQGMMIDNKDLNILIDNSKLFHGLSPVIESYNGIEVLKAIYDRYGFEIISLEDGSIHFITGQIEESFALNPKCFALSRLYANKILKFTYSKEDPARYLNKLLIETNTGVTSKVDTNLFIHEHLY